MTLTRSLRTAALAVLGFVLTAPMAAAQSQAQPAPAGKVDLTLEDAVRRAVEHNPDLAVVRLDSNAQSARVAEARGAFVPLFNQKLGRSNSASAPSSFLTGINGRPGRPRTAR
jgi:outer membrane protein TolC